ncbi:hypothetical protein JJQ72_03015 [Paenibacillus sp. F411]|uniref:Uncharacterized protein n=1 Tax=Paenibacillus algicola TaxID=2565926 RepID=A0A4P8XME8_9BACL|nr:MULTISPECIES: hypothetical protein [Paenibacillus]MBO2942949.1 hypothetical protein [Paenibacillus sp. F411]QCT02850.1 hypothetical protein E6C60_2135 [Paenibacillus algicola]
MLISYTIERAAMQLDEEKHFTGSTVFNVEDHPESYEVTFMSKDGKNWDYSLHFAGEPGPEEKFLQVDEWLELHDDLFDDLLDAAIDAGGFE